MGEQLTRRDIPKPLLKQFPDIKKWNYKRIVTTTTAYNLGLALMDQAWKAEIDKLYAARKSEREKQEAANG